MKVKLMFDYEGCMFVNVCTSSWFGMDLLGGHIESKLCCVFVLDHESYGLFDLFSNSTVATKTVYLSNNSLR